MHVAFIAIIISVIAILLGKSIIKIDWKGSEGEQRKTKRFVFGIGVFMIVVALLKILFLFACKAFGIQ